MKAMILAAGHGKRMRPLTDKTPKPLLTVAGKPLIVYHIEKLARIGVVDIVINHAWLGEQIEAALGDGAAWGVRIQYSAEGEPLETGAGIARALPLLGEQPFIVASGDVWTDFDYAVLLNRSVRSAHLVLVNNPEHHPGGDFALSPDGLVSADKSQGRCFTYSGIAILHPRLFADAPRGPFPLRDPLLAAMSRGWVTGEYFAGEWADIGTPERLALLDQRVSASQR